MCLSNAVDNVSLRWRLGPLWQCRHFAVDTQGPFTEDIPQLVNKRGKPQAALKRDNTHTYTQSVSKEEENHRKRPGDSVKRGNTVQTFPPASLPHCLSLSAGKKKND